MTVAGVPVFWKTKFTFIAMSTAESELLEATNVLTVTRSVDVLVKEMRGVEETKMRIKGRQRSSWGDLLPIVSFPLEDKAFEGSRSRNGRSN